MKRTTMKNLGTRAALALPLAFLLSAALPARGGTVYRPGLWQASLSGSGNWTANILSASGVERAPGTMMAEVTSSTNNPITGTTCTWGGNQTWGYAGQMYMRAGITYHFYKYVDDNGNYVVDGTTILDNHTTWNSFAHCSHTPLTTGWKDVDLRFGNGGGGAGRSGLFGAGWNTNGISASQTTGWEHIVDPGDCSLLRVATGESFSSAAAADMIIGSAGLSLALSHENLPAGATLYALLDSADRGTDRMDDWAAVESLGAVPSGTGEEYYMVANATASGVLRLVLASPGISADAFVEWLDPVDLTSVASDGALTLGATVTTDYDAVDVSVIVPSLGPASSVALTVELSTVSDFSTGVSTQTLSSATAAGATASAHFGSLAADTAHWVRVTATPDVGDAISKVYQTATRNPRPVFSAFVNTDHLVPDVSLSFIDAGWGSAVTKITVQVSTSDDFTHPSLSQVYSVNLASMPTNFDGIALSGLPASSPLYYRFIAENTGGFRETVDLSAASSLNGNNVWSGLSEDIADPAAYVFEGGLPASGKTLYFTTPAGLSPVVDRDTAMPSLRFTNGKTDSADTSYLDGYHSCGYDLSGSGVLTFTAEKPILHGTKGTNVIENPLLFNRSNSQTVYVCAPGGRLDLTGELMLPDNVTNTTMRVNGDGGEIHFGGPSPDFMGTLYLESTITLSLDHPNAMTNVRRIFFGGGWGSRAYLKNNTGAPMVFPRCEIMEDNRGDWQSARVNYYGAPFVFPVGHLIWGSRQTDDNYLNADLLVKDLTVAKHGSNGSAILDKLGTGLLAVSGTTDWDANNCQHTIRLRNGCFWPQTAAGQPPSGEYYAPDGANNNMGTLGLSGDYTPMLDGSSTPCVFQGNTQTRWGFTGFGGDRTVCWNGDSSLNLTNTTSDNVSIKLSDATTVNSVGKTYNNYYAYPARFMFGNRSEFADGTVLFLNSIRYELGQNWDTATYFESTNHVVAARLRGSLKLGNRDRTWNFSGRNFGGYLALEADNADFTGRVNVYEKGNLLVNANLAARSITVQSGAGLGGTDALSTEEGTTVKNGGSLFGGEWNKGGVLTLGGKVTFESGSALRVEVGASNDRIGMVKLAPGSTLKLTAPVYVDVDTDPRISPVRGAGIKVLDWSETHFDSGAAPKSEDFVARPESNSDIKSIRVSARSDGLYVNYITYRLPLPAMMILR